MYIYFFSILTRSSLRAVQSSPYQLLCSEFSARGATSHKESRQPQGFYRLEVRKWPTYILLSSVWPVLCQLSLFTITGPPNRKPTPVSKATIDYILWAALSTRAIVTWSTLSGGVVVWWCGCLVVWSQCCLVMRVHAQSNTDHLVIAPWRSSTDLVPPKVTEKSLLCLHILYMSNTLGKSGRILL